MVIRLLPGSNEHCLLYRYHSTSIDGNCNQTLRQKAEEQLLLMHATFGEGLYNIDRDTSAYPRLPVSDERSDYGRNRRTNRRGVSGQPATNISASSAGFPTAIILLWPGIVYAATDSMRCRFRTTRGWESAVVPTAMTRNPIGPH